jgi:hypothetical protein
MDGWMDVANATAEETGRQADKSDAAYMNRIPKTTEIFSLSESPAFTRSVVCRILSKAKQSAKNLLDSDEHSRPNAQWTR